MGYRVSSAVRSFPSSIFIDKNRCGIVKSQSKWTAGECGIAGGVAHGLQLPACVAMWASELSSAPPLLRPDDSHAARARELGGDDDDQQQLVKMRGGGRDDESGAGNSSYESCGGGSGNLTAVALLTLAENATQTPVVVQFAELGLRADTVYCVADVWTGQTLFASARGSFEHSLPGHGSLLAAIYAMS